VEDYTGKLDLALFGEDYVRYKDYFTPGTVLHISGGFRSRFGQEDNLEFKISAVTLLETIKKTQTKQVIMDMPPQLITKEMVEFFETNIRTYPGKTSLKFTLTDRAAQWRISLITAETGIEMNDE